jgi:uncharacterized repeat protein (TIGR03803 family)
MFALLPSRLTRLCALLLPLACLLPAGRLNAQTPPPPALVVTHTFNNLSPLDEGYNAGTLVQGSDGFFYGVTRYGGIYGSGTLFKVRGDGSGFSLLYSFSYYADPNPSSIVQGSDGALYGTAAYSTGGSTGSVFRINTDGSGLATLHDFGGSPPNMDGITLSGRLMQGSDGYFYGATASGGSGGGGTLFKVSPDGLSFSVLHSFSSQNGTTDASGAMPSALTLGANGILYGTTHVIINSTNSDAIFKINTDGSGFTVLLAPGAGPSAAAAQSPNSPLTFGTDGALYGAMSSGGAAGTGDLFKVSPDGSSFTQLHSFAAIPPSPNGTINTNSDGSSPLSLVQAGDGYFYGAATYGGANGYGTVFRVSADGSVFQVLHTFSASQSTAPPPAVVNPDGAYPQAPFTVGADGLVYGTAGAGGLNMAGTVFRLITSHTHILWNNTDGTASLWSVDTSGSYTHAEYGPYPGWTATAVASGGDGLTHLLWNHAPDGEMALWTVDAANSITHQEYGPYPGWAADALAAGPSGLPDVFWNYTTPGGFGSLSAGTASLWNVNSDGSFLYQDFGPFPGWTATALAIGGNSLPSLLWNHSDDGEIALSSIAPSASPSAAAASTLYGPFAGWTATALSAGADSVPHILWNNVSGQASVWNVNADTTYQHFEYGPYPGWNALGLATGPDNISHLLWDYTDGTLSLWSIDTGTGTFAFQNYGPFAGWTAVAASAGP